MNGALRPALQRKLLDAWKRRNWLACLLCAAVLGYVAWEWQQAPNGLVNLGSLQTTGDRDHDD